MMPPLQLSALPRAFRFGLGCLVLVLLAGLAAGAVHMYQHHENRDAQPGLSLDDVRGAYHGIEAEAPLLRAVNRGHPEGMPNGECRALVDWLHGDAEQIALRYDDEAAGEMAPALILERRCLSCHSRTAVAGDGIGKRMPLEYLDEVKALAVSRHVEPTAVPIVLASAHTHALAMGSLSVVVLLLGLGTRWPMRLLAVLAGGAGLGLLLDLGAWVPVRVCEELVYVLVAGGGLWFGCTAATLLLVLVDLLRPAPRA